MWGHSAYRQAKWPPRRDANVKTMLAATTYSTLVYQAVLPSAFLAWTRLILTTTQGVQMAYLPYFIDEKI